MEKKIVVPEGMLRAAIGDSYLDSNHDKAIAKSALEAALRWLSENPIMPTDEQTEEMRRMFHCTVRPLTVYRDVAVEWQRRMFLAPEPNPIVLEIRQRLLGHTLTQLEADLIIWQINSSVRPR